MLGMHRSGTSAVTRGLAVLGVSLGDNLMRPAAGDNEKGFFEDLDIYQLNERLLKKGRSAWHKLAPLDDASMAGPEFSPERREAAALLSRKLGAGAFGFKDPRAAVLLPFWQCVFEDLDLEDRYVVVVRNPIEAAISLEARDGIDLAKGVALWAKHTIEALRRTDGKTRVFVAYERMLADPLAELRRMAEALGLPQPDAESDSVKEYCGEFLTPALRHNRIGAGELKRSGLAPGFVAELHDIVMGFATSGDGVAQIDAWQWRDIVSRYQESAPLLSYADRIDDDRLAARKQLDAAATRLREAAAALQRATAEAEAAASARANADQEAAKLAAALKAMTEARAAEAAIAREERAELRAQAARAVEAKEAVASQLRAMEVARERTARALDAELQRLAQGQVQAREQVAQLTARGAADAEAIGALEARLHQAEQTLRAADEAHAAERAAFARDKRRADAQIEAARRQAAAAKVQSTQKSHELEQFVLTAAEREREIAQLAEQNASLLRQFRDSRRDLLLARAALTETRGSTSWRLTVPLRGVGMILSNPIGGTRAVARAAARAIWRRLPMPAEQRGRLAARIFAAAPALFSWSRAYKAWAAAGRTDGSEPGECVEPSPDPALEGHVPLLATAPPQSVSARAIAFYLPQFHPIPENDRWWGDGFTEWTKVRAAEPRFEGHYQPHEPGELGYYDLLKDDGVMRRQAELAKLHGIGGFCFYFYWFGGQRLLEAPIRKFHDSPDIDMPFCLCWANENWTRRWDGRADEVLIAQKHSADDDIAFIKHVSQYFRDARYIRIHGRPLLVVYRPDLLPSAKATAERWRRWLRENGMGEVYLAFTQSFEHAPPAHYGFDAAIEFPPNNMGLVSEPSLAGAPGSRLAIYDWRRLRARGRRYAKPAYTLFRGVCPQWDNTPRRPHDGAVFVNTSPSAFSGWMKDAVRDSVARFSDPQERLVFINAWNEWAEGAHLEPDRKHGYAWLEAARRALDPDAEKRKLLIVTHDLHRHGAQYLALHLMRTLRRRFGIEVAAISGEPGALGPAFEAEGPLTIIEPRSTSDADADAAISALTERGFRHAIVNSAASGWIAPKLAANGVKMAGLVHELPTMIERMNLTRGLKDLDRCAEALVFPAASVRDRDAKAIGVAAWRNGKVLHQGLYKAGVIIDISRKEEARGRVSARLGLPADAKIVVGVGYADERKGADIFIAWAAAAAKRWPHAHFVWIGATPPELEHKLKRWLAGAGEQRGNIHFPGFAEDTSDFYAGATIYALCSREDPFPSTALEALAAATPVITVRGTGGIEELEAHHCVRAIANAEASTFVAAAAEWFEDEAAAHAAGESGRDLMRDRFGFVSYAGALTDLLELGAPNVSVVVPNYNYARHLEQRLRSILDQTLAPREILVLDDASSDDSIAVAERVLADAPINWRILRNAQNAGDVFSQWRRGVELAQGELVWIAEADDWADTRFLEAAVRPFQRRDVVLSMTQSHQVSGDGSILANDYLDYVRDVSPDKWKRAFTGDGPAEVREGLSIKNTIPNASAVVFRRAALLEALNTHAREIGSYRVAGDWCAYVNLLRQGALAFSPAALNYHRRHHASVTIAKFDLAELAEIARMQAYVAREFAPPAEYAQRGRAYLESLVKQFGLDRRWAPAQIEGAMRGVIAA